MCIRDRVLVVVVLGCLTDGVGRVADDDPDVESLLVVGAGVVAGEENLSLIHILTLPTSDLV